MATTVKASNVFEPAPRWFRMFKKILYTLAGSSIVTGTLQRFGVSDADCLLIMGWLVLLGELLGSVLANGETYANAPHTNTNLTIVKFDSLPKTPVDGVDYYLVDGNYWYFNANVGTFTNGGATLPTKGF